MPIKMERRYEPGTQKYYVQKHAKNRRLVNKKKTLLVEYREAVERALKNGTPLPEEPTLAIMRRDSEECLFADNRQFEESDGMGPTEKREKRKKKSKSQLKEEEEEMERKKKEEEEARARRRRRREREQRRLQYGDPRYMQSFPQAPYGYPGLPPFYPPAPHYGYGPYGYPEPGPAYHNYPPQEYRPVTEERGSTEPPEHPQIQSRSRAATVSPGNGPEIIPEGQTAKHTGSDPLHLRSRAATVPSNVPEHVTEHQNLAYQPVQPEHPKTKQEEPRLRRISEAHLSKAQDEDSRRRQSEVSGIDSRPLSRTASRSYTRQHSRSDVRLDGSEHALQSHTQDFKGKGKEKAFPTETQDQVKYEDDSYFVPNPPASEHLQRRSQVSKGKGKAKAVPSSSDSRPRPSTRYSYQSERSVSSSPSELAYELDTPVIPRLTMEQAFQDLYFEVDKMISEVEYNYDDNDAEGPIARNFPPRKVQLDIDVGDATLHVDVKMAFQALREGDVISRDDFDFCKEESYSEGLDPGIIRRQKSSGSVIFHGRF